MRAIVVGEQKKEREFRPHTLIYYCHKMCHKFSNKQKKAHWPYLVVRSSDFLTFSIQLKLQLKTFPCVYVASFFECELFYELKESFR